MITGIDSKRLACYNTYVRHSMRTRMGFKNCPRCGIIMPTTEEEDEEGTDFDLMCNGCEKAMLMTAESQSE